MLVLKEPVREDSEKLYEAIREMPFYENGFGNEFAEVSYPVFRDIGIRKMQESGRGINIRPGRVPQSYFFLWDDDKVVGLFKIRHYLNRQLRSGSGHIGFGIIPQYRGLGYASKGLALTLEKAKDIVKEDTVYMSCFRYNTPSLKAMLANGAWIDHEDDEICYTRVKIR